MHQISGNESVRRWKTEIAEDVLEILKAPGDVRSKRALLTQVCWMWSKSGGAIRGCPHSTIAATLLKAANPKAKLKHEHAVPRRDVVEFLQSLDPPTPNGVIEILERLVIGIVVTAEEADLLNAADHRKMPPEFFDPSSTGFHNPWLRFDRCRESGIQVVHRTDNRLS